MEITLKSKTKPFSIRVPRRIPFGWREKVKYEIDWMERQGIIEKVAKPTEWCHPLVVVPKPDGGIRVCVDMTKLNDHVIRPLYPITSPWQAASEIPNSARYFTVFDAVKGYWQMKLAEKSQEMTTFITPWGRYKYVRAPMGLVHTGDEFCRVGDEAMEGIQNMTKVVDDMLVYDNAFPEHVRHVWECLQRCRKHRITLSAKKLKFAKSEVSFCGYRVSDKGVGSDPTKVRAIKDFPSPRNIHELRSFFGLLRQISPFEPSVSACTEPLRPLLSTKNEYVWQPEHETAFNQAKAILTEMPTLARFDPKLPTAVHTDASRKGLGYILMQRHGSTWRYVECGSRFLLPAETRYAMVELELTAVVWAVRQKLTVYLQGLQHFDIVIDHKPLVPILNDYTLADIQNPRLLRLKEKLMGYQFKAKWVKGSDHAIADALSRAPVDQPTEHDRQGEADLNAIVTNSVILRMAEFHAEDATALHDDALISNLKAVGENDEAYRQLAEAVSTGFPRSQGQCPPAIKPFWKMRDNLSIEDGLVLMDGRLVVPGEATPDVLRLLHGGHQGMVKTKRRARQCVYWPGMGCEIEKMVQSCLACQEKLPSHAQEPMMSDERPQWVFQETGVDLFQYGSHHYMVYVDRLSGWPCVCVYYNHAPTAKEVIEVIRKWFVDLGVPVKLRSDNGPQFASKEFKRFLTRWSVNHAPSTPRYPQSNGLAEAAVKNMKRLLQKTSENGRFTEEFWQGLLEYRNTPLVSGVSPAEYLYGHVMRTMVPTHHCQFQTKWQEKAREAETKYAESKARTEAYYNRSAYALRPLKVKDEVIVQDTDTKKWDKAGVVVGVGKRRDYLVKYGSGRVQWRNRRFIRLSKSVKGDDGSTKTDAPKKVAFADETMALRRSQRARNLTDFYRA